LEYQNQFFATLQGWNSMKIGDVFGRLTVTNMDIQRKRYVSVVCECGNEKEVRMDHLIKGETKSCGCYLREVLIKRNSKHLMSNTSEYKTWRSMIHRCNNEKDKRFIDYGGRGISVCKRWEKFESFLSDMGMKPFVGAQIDRINNNCGYYKSNCKWSSRKENQRNMRSNRFITYRGERVLLITISERFGINHSTLRKRLSRGWSVEKAIETTVIKLRKKKTKKEA